MLKHFINLQLFGEGGDGGDGGSASPTGEDVADISGEDSELASIPEKARKYYKKAVEKTSQPVMPTNNTSQNATEKIPYADLIKSDDYKEEHKAYMEKTISDRLKKYKGLEDEYGKARSALDIVANKYGVNPSDENFLEVLSQKIEADDSYYENYAMEHDISTDEARRVVTMERKVAEIEKQKEEASRQEAMRQQLITLHQNAEKTKMRFPSFDLETEMQSEQFRRLCAVNNGDTTAAYMACHWNEILPAQVQLASQQIRNQTAQAMAYNQARPMENGVESNAPSVVSTNFKGMSLEQIRAYAAEQRRKGR